MTMINPLIIVHAKLKNHIKNHSDDKDIKKLKSEFIRLDTVLKSKKLI